MGRINEPEKVGAAGWVGVELLLLLCYIQSLEIVPQSNMEECRSIEYLKFIHSETFRGS